jgi:hypothetical protein
VRAVVTLLVVAGGCRRAGAAEGAPVDLRAGAEPMKGITLAPIEDVRLGDVGYGSAHSAVALDEIVELGATWASITPFGTMDDLRDTEVCPEVEKPLAQNLVAVREVISQAQSRGLSVLVVPHVFVWSGEWRGLIEPGSEAGWRAWFDSYERFVLLWATVAAETDADAFSVGVEFLSSSQRHAWRWKDLVARVREVYRGPITYSANWDEVEHVAFWDDVDFLCLNAFQPLSDRPGAGRAELTAGARRFAAEVAEIARLHDKPFALCEMGFKKMRDPAVRPWEWPEAMDASAVDPHAQATAYRALLAGFVPEPRFAGLFVWKYFSDPWDWTQEEPFGFSPRGALGEEVLREAFARPWRPAE